MAIKTDDEFVRFVQDRMAKAGHYTAKVDGIAGPGTMAALDKAMPPIVVLPKPAMPTTTAPVTGTQGDNIPDAGDKKLLGVNPVLVAVIREASLRSAVPFTVIEGLRSAARQKELVAAGMSKTQNSRHLTGHAVDIWPLDANGNTFKSDAAFKAGSPEARDASAKLWAALRQIAVTIKQVAKERGVMMEHGVDWGWDAPHHQLNRKAYP